MNNEQPIPTTAKAKVAFEAAYRNLPNAALTIYEVEGARLGISCPVDDDDAKGVNHWRRGHWLTSEQIKEHDKKCQWERADVVKAKDVVYGLSHVTGSHVYICAGPPDVWTLRCAGLDAITFMAGESALPSARAIRKLLGKGIRDVTLVYDTDKAGVDGAKKAADLLLRHGLAVKVLTLPEYKDVKDVSDFWIAFCGDKQAFLKELKTPALTTEHAVLLPQCAADIETKRVAWLWPYHLPRDGMTLLSGPEGLGKSLFTLDLAARVSTGAAWPNSDPENYRRAGSVLVLSSEDLANSTIVPRLQQQRADLKRVHIIDKISFGPYMLPDGQDLVEANIRRLRSMHGGPVLVVLDPIDVFVECNDSWKSDKVRKALAMVDSLAARTGATFLGIQHINKNSKDTNPNTRMTGSRAFAQHARASMYIDLDPTDKQALDEQDQRRAVVVPKHNLSIEPPALGFNIIDVGTDSPGRLVWYGPLPGVTANNLLKSEQGDSQLDLAREFILGVLSEGPRSAEWINTEGREIGCSQRTVERARADLRKERQIEYFEWATLRYWRLAGDSRSPLDGGFQPPFLHGDLGSGSPNEVRA